MRESHAGVAAHQVVADYFEAQAVWRAGRGVDRPDDPRTARCAAGLRFLAAYVRRLPPGDERVRDLYQRCCTGPHGAPLEAFDAGGRVAFATARFRFHDPTEDCDAFLTRLAALALDDRVDALGEGGVLPRWLNGG